MFIHELDTHGNCVRADNSRLADDTESADDESYNTAVENIPRGLGISVNNMPPMSPSRITTAAAAASTAPKNWPHPTLRETELWAEQRDLDAELRRRSTQLPRPETACQRAIAEEHEVLDEMAAFLRSVTPPATNYMSLPSPASPAVASSIASSIRRRNSIKKKGPLRRCLSLLRRGTLKRKSQRKSEEKPTAPAPSEPARAPSTGRAKKLPRRLRLPDTVVAGTTVKGFRHIAISIPVEHAHLGPEPRYKFPKADRRTKSTSAVARSPSEAGSSLYNDVNIRPLSALTNEPHIGTQLGPVAEERESLSSMSLDKVSQSSQEQARKARLASRNTFGTVQAVLSRPNNMSNTTPTSRPKTSHLGDEPEPSTPRNSGEIRNSAYQQTLGALTRPSTAPGPVSNNSAHGFRSFASAAPGSRVYYPTRKSSLQPNVQGVPESSTGRPRTRSNSDQRGRKHSYGQQQSSRDSSRDQVTLQESIFSEPLESMGTLESASEPDSAFIRDAARAKRISAGAETASTSQRDSSASEREVRSGKQAWKRMSGESIKRASGGSSKGSSGRSAKEDDPLESDSAATTVVLFDPQSPQKAEPQAESLSREAEPEPEPAQVAEESVDEELVEAAQSEEVKWGVKEEELVDGPRPQHEVEPKGKEKQEVPDETLLKVPGQSQRNQQNGKERQHMLQKSPSSVSKKDQELEGKEKREVLEESPLIVPQQQSQDGKDKGKGKERETSEMQNSKDVVDVTSGMKKEEEEGKLPSSLPNPKQRREQRQAKIRTRRERIAELQMMLDKPGSQPKDLVMERRLSISPQGSVTESSGTHSTINSESDTITPVPSIKVNSPGRLKANPEPTPVAQTFSAVMTVVDVQPTNPPPAIVPGMGITRRESLPLSVSSPTTVTTIFKASPIPPYRSLGSVTPPDSPPLSRSSSSQHSAVEATSPSTQLRHPPLKRLNSLRRRPSASVRRSPSSPSYSGRRSPDVLRLESPQRPKTAGKGVVASKKDFFGARQFAQQSASSTQDEVAVGNPTSALKMSRSELFERYEALREKQAHDMERRLGRLERNGDYWLRSMLPLLTDLSQTLGRLATAGDKEVERENDGGGITDRRPNSRYDHGRQNRMRSRGVPDDDGRRMRRTPDVGDDHDALDEDEAIVRHSYASGRSRAGTGGSQQRRRRVFLRDETTEHPDLNHRFDNFSFDDEDGRARSVSLGHGSRRPAHLRRAKTASGQLPGITDLHRALHTSSGATTAVNSTGLINLMGSQMPSLPLALPLPEHLRQEVEAEMERLEHIEGLNERIDSRMERLSVGHRSSKSSKSPDVGSAPVATVARGPGGLAGLARWGSQSELSVGTGESWGGRHAGHAGRAGSGMETLEPLMRELQLSGHRLSMESVGEGDSEVQRLREGPRPVVGFGAFSGN